MAAVDGPGFAHGRPRPLNLDDLFLDAREVVVLAALKQIGDDPEARFRFLRRLLAVEEDEAVRVRLS